VVFVHLIQAADIKKTFICYARADAVASNPELIAALTAIGFRYFIVGLEAIADAELEDYNKKTTEAINRKCIENIHEAGANCIALMMVSHKATKKEFDDIYRWAKNNRLVYITVSIFTPIPGTPLYDSYSHEITSTRIEDWDFLHLVLKPQNLSKRMFYWQYFKLTYKLFRLGKKAGAFDFLSFKSYYHIVRHYLSHL
jgi:hopanoid C-3 methylase